jgi:hypothetical protein
MSSAAPIAIIKKNAREEMVEALQQAEAAARKAGLL